MKNIFSYFHQMVKVSLILAEACLIVSEIQIEIPGHLFANITTLYYSLLIHRHISPEFLITPQRGLPGVADLHCEFQPLSRISCSYCEFKIFSEHHLAHITMQSFAAFLDFVSKRCEFKPL